MVVERDFWNGHEKRRCKNLRGVAKIKSETRFCYQMEIQV